MIRMATFCLTIILMQGLAAESRAQATQATQASQKSR
jgi:hypothetical protein